MPADRTSRPRQDPVSCDSCRKKKLKCDRAQPCSNCIARGIACTFNGRATLVGGDGQVPAHSAVQVASIADVQAENAAIKERLRRLEDLVLYPNGHPAAETTPATSASSSLSVVVETEESKRLKGDIEWLLNIGNQRTKCVPDLYRTPLIHVEPLDRIITHAAQGSIDDLTVRIPLEHEAMAFFDEYVAKKDPGQHIIHVPTVRASIASLYHDLVRSPRVEIQRVMLPISLIAIISVHSGKTGPLQPHPLYDTVQAARQTSVYFLRTALDVLDIIRRAGSVSLETVQASALLAFLLFHVEGFSSRTKAIQSYGLSLARDLGLHKTDLNRDPKMHLSQNEIIDLEMRRRVWWHLASTDWAFSVTPGAHEGTYTVHPAHMKVNKPRNISDEELQTRPADFSHPRSVPTIMAYSLQRIDLNDVCRQLTDLAPYMMFEHMSPDDFITIDREFDRIIRETPWFLKSEPGRREELAQLDLAHPYLPFQRHICLLFIQSRRCQMHMPFLLKASYDPSYARSRELCLQSARDVITCHEELILNPNGPHSGVPINPLLLMHFFATVVLLMDFCANKAAVDETARKAEIEVAVKMLEEAKKRTNYAELLLDSLTAMLLKHQIRLRQPDNEAPIRDLASDQAPTLPPYPNTFSEVPADVSVPLDFDEMWRDFVDAGAPLNQQSWDTLLNDFDVMV